MQILEFIAARRDGKVHSEADIRSFVTRLTAGEIPDYQISAWLMAAVLKPLTADETAWLTMAMAESGERLDLSSLPKPWVDKHSTGGVGDKTTLVVLPMLAACGLTVVKMSGRGLGITGGTIDKLSSVPGFNLNLTPEEMIRQAARIGIAITGQTPRLAPADKILYALRDATSTIESIPLIASSILSKKIAGGAQTIVLDVKCGSGAFMKNLSRARELATALVDIGRRCGLRVEAVITDMDQVLGDACGNAMEVVEAGRVLCRKGPARFEELCVHLTGVTLHAAGQANSLDEGRKKATECLTSGKALLKAEEWFEAQGANPQCLVDSSWAPKAPVRGVVKHMGQPAYIAKFDAEAVGRAVLRLGGGRLAKDDVVDPAVGIEVHVRVGDLVQAQQPLFTIFAKSDDDAMAVRPMIDAGIEVSPNKVIPLPLVLG